MKGLAWGIFIGFVALLAVSLYVAERTYDGTVEEDYYRKSVDYFRNEGRAVRRSARAEGAALPGGMTVLLDIAPKPVRAMRELSFSVAAPGYDGPGRPWIDLGMAGMRMAPNRVDLVREAAGMYRGKGTVVRCPSGMRTWTATVHLPGRGVARFTFDVSD